MRILGLILTTAIFVVGMGDVTLFIDMQSIVFVVVGTLGMLLLGGNSIAVMFRSVFSDDATVGELQAGARGWKMARTYSLATGVIGTVMGWVIMGRAEWENITDFGAGFSISILTVFYALWLSFGLFLPLQARLEDRI